jgi:putative phosphoserine phosphatase/1-acylglycerol-3-phosphate O-acyltransferase
MKRVGTTLRIAASFALLSIGSLVMLGAAILTLGLARRFYSETIGRRIGKGVLALSGIRYRVHGTPAAADRQTVYISNHTSTLDIFILIALALPKTRFFLSGFLRKIVPIGIVGTLIRIFWTVPQEYPARRRAIFKRADRILRRTRDSVYLSPEGMRVTTGEIGAFNKGAFHLATSLHAQIVPIYIAIPRDIDPGMGYAAKPGTTDVYFLPPIDTSSWQLADLNENRAAVRDLFIRLHESMRSTGRLPASLSISTPEPAREAVVA